MDVAADEHIGLVHPARAVVVDQASGHFTAATIAVMVVQLKRFVVTIAKQAVRHHKSPIAASHNRRTFPAHERHQLLRQIHLMPFEDVRLMVPWRNQRQLPGVWLEPVKGGADQQVEIVAAAVFLAQRILRGPWIPFALHGAEQVTERKDRAVLGLGLLQCFPQQTELAVRIIPVYIRQQQDAATGAAAFHGHVQPPRVGVGWLDRPPGISH